MNSSQTLLSVSIWSDRFLKNAVQYMLLAALAALCSNTAVTGFLLLEYPHVPGSGRLVQWLFENRYLLSRILFPVLWLFFFYLMSDYLEQNFRFSLVDFGLSCTFSFLFVVGYYQQISGSELFFLPSDWRNRLLFAVVMLLFTYIAVQYTHLTFDRLTALLIRNRNADIRTYRMWIVSILLIFWLPFLIANFPGSVCNDARVQFSQFWGNAQLSNNNPVFDTVVFGTLFRIGEAIGKTDNAGIAAITVAQLILYLCAFTYTIETVMLATQSPISGCLLLLFFGISPTFGGALQNVLKDSFHLPWMMLYLSVLIRAMYLKKDPSVWLFSLVFLLSALTRKAAFAYVLCGGLSLILYSGKTGGPVRKWTAAVLSCSAVFLLYHFILLPAAKVEMAPAVESLSLPIQNLAYIVQRHYNELTAEELRMIDAVVDVRQISSLFDPNISDPMKGAFRSSPEALLAASVMLAKKYPLDSLCAVLTTSWKYFFPLSTGYFPYRSYMAAFAPIGRDIHFAFPTLQGFMVLYARVWEKAPVLSLLVGPGLYSWIILFLFAKSIKGKNKALFCLLLMFAVMLFGFLLTPVNGENRYAYPLIGAAPVLLILACCPAAPDKRTIAKTASR